MRMGDLCAVTKKAVLQPCVHKQMGPPRQPAPRLAKELRPGGAKTAGFQRVMWSWRYRQVVSNLPVPGGFCGIL